jgi:hypothetical protein
MGLIVSFSAPTVEQKISSYKSRTLKKDRHNLRLFLGNSIFLPLVYTLSVTKFRNEDAMRAVAPKDISKVLDDCETNRLY